MIILEKNINLLPDEKDFIDFIKSPDFSLYYSKATSDNFHQFSHSFITRHESNLEKEGEINSSYSKRVLNLFKRICEENNIKYNKIYRASLNITVYYPDLHGEIHEDHSFKHHVFIMYLNKFDFGYTYLFDQNKKMTDIIYPSENKCVIFEGDPHTQGFCSPGQRRISLVITFGIN